jgi:hypothetical protein
MIKPEDATSAPPQADKAPPPVEPKSAPEPPTEIGGPPGPEPTRYGDWQYKGRCTDF